MTAIKDLIGLKFGRLKVLEFSGRQRTQSNIRIVWKCQCDCGNITITCGIDLTRGMSKSCGCLKIDKLIERSVTHGFQRGDQKNAEYRTWRHIKSRCYNPNVERYPNYGGRGIKMCERWKHSFENFYADMGPRPSVKHSIDRFPDVNGDYEPGNCRWATIEEQMRGMTNNHWLEYKGKKLVLSDWANELKTFPSNINRMLKKKSFKEIVDYYKDKNHINLLA